MATVNQDNQDPNQQAPTGGPVSISGTAGASASAGQGPGATGVAAPGAASPVSTQQPQTNQGYTDVGSYLDANQAGAAQMGNQVAGNLTSTYNDATKAIDKSGNAFIDAVNNGYTPQQDTSGMLANAVQTASDPNQVKAFQGQLNDSYTGPSSYSDYGTQQGNIAQAQQYGSLVNTPGGTNVLAQGLEGPQASQGVNQLDTMLLNGSPGAAQAMQTAAAPYAGLNSYLDQYNTTGNNAIAANTATANAASQSAQGNLANTVNQFNTGLTNQLGTAQAATDAYNKQVADTKAAYQSGNIGSIQGVDPRLTAFQNNYISPFLAANKGYTINAPNFMNALPDDTAVAAPTLAQTSTAQDYAKQAALSRLAGSSISSPLDPSLSAQADTYKLPTASATNNQKLAAAMEEEFGGPQGRAQGTVSAPGGYQNVADIINALSRYQGNGNTDNTNLVGGTKPVDLPI